MTDIEWRRLAEDRYASETIELAEEGGFSGNNVSEGDDGAWVLAWVWVPRPKIDMRSTE